MPIRPENKGRYPMDWEAIRQRILRREGHACKWCRVRNYAVGWRDPLGRFHPTGGNEEHDLAGEGGLPYADARAVVEHANEWCGGLGPNDEKGLVIVLTIAHLNHVPEDCREENLAALCQRCHNRHDRRHRLGTIRERRYAGQGALSLPADPARAGG